MYTGVANSSVAVVRQRQRAPLFDVPEQNRRPLGGNEQRFPFGEWCPRKGRSAVTAGGGRKGLDKGVANAGQRKHMVMVVSCFVLGAR